VHLLLSLGKDLRLAYTFFQGLAGTPLTPRQKLGLAVGAFFTLGAAAAFSIAPGSSVPQSTIVEALPTAVPARDMPLLSILSRSERIQRGDNLVSMLARAGVRDPALINFIKADSASSELLKPRTGQLFSLEIGSDGRLMRLSSIVPTPIVSGHQSKAAKPAAATTSDDVQLPSSTATRLLIERPIAGGDGFKSRLETVQLLRSVEVKSATIRGSIFGATDAAGIPDMVVYQLGEIFDTEIDFDQDVRKGDTLRVVYETLRIQDSLEAASPGRVLAAEYTSKKRSLNALWFEREGGRGEYYTGEGKALRKSFLRSPLEFTRVSSGFTENRLHPVFRDWRAHKGVDYAAPSGTKVRTIGDGVIEFAGTQRGYGNVLVVKHNDRNSTLYAHLSEFAKEAKVGKKVLQGDVIGAVGQTGWATGPHLHFEFKIDGQPADPLNLALPPARPMNVAELKKFSLASTQLREMLGLAASLRTARFE
jgi:murein DD-endopeptidase MepM/ murein hydrolase activator NlpD